MNLVTNLDDLINGNIKINSVYYFTDSTIHQSFIEFEKYLLILEKEFTDVVFNKIEVNELTEDELNKVKKITNIIPTLYLIKIEPNSTVTIFIIKGSLDWEENKSNLKNVFEDL